MPPFSSTIACAALCSLKTTQQSIDCCALSVLCQLLRVHRAMFCVAYFECIVKCYFKFILILFQLAWATVISRLCSLLPKATVSALWAWYVLPTVFFLRVFMYLFFWRIKWWWWWWWWCGGTKAPVCQMCRGTWRCRNLACWQHISKLSRCQDIFRLFIPNISIWKMTTRDLLHFAT